MIGGIAMAAPLLIVLLYACVVDRGPMGFRTAAHWESQLDAPGPVTRLFVEQRQPEYPSMPRPVREAFNVLHVVDSRMVRPNYWREEQSFDFSQAPPFCLEAALKATADEAPKLKL